jgi:DivIVA domain-containing protein
MDEVSPSYLRDDVEFQVRLRGYDPEQVDDLLDRVAGGIELLQQQLRQALERAARAEQQATVNAETDHALRNTLVMAQRAADMAVAEAEERAAAIVAAAETRAAEIVGAAEEAARAAAAEGQRRLRDDLARLEAARGDLQGDVASLEEYLQGERARLRSLLTEQLQRLEAVGATRLTPAPAPRQIDVPPPPVVPADEGEATQAVDEVGTEEPATDAEVGASSVEAPAGDAFMAELRRAVSDDEPLGPRDHRVHAAVSDDELSLPDRSRWGLRRRR